MNYYIKLFKTGSKSTCIKMHLHIDEKHLWQWDLRHIRYPEVLNVREICTTLFHVVICGLQTINNQRLKHTDTLHQNNIFYLNQATHLRKVLEDMADLHVSLPHLQVQNFISILLKHVRSWKVGGVGAHIRLELSLDLAGICGKE